MYVHKVPIHLETEDKFLYSLTLRQCAVLGIGATMAYTSFFSVFTQFPDAGLGFVLGLVVALCLLLCAVALAFATIFGRGLDTWAMVLLVYIAQPRTYVWCFASPDIFEQVSLSAREQRRSRHQNLEDDTW